MLLTAYVIARRAAERCHLLLPVPERVYDDHVRTARDVARERVVAEQEYRLADRTVQIGEQFGRTVFGAFDLDGLVAECEKDVQQG